MKYRFPSLALSRLPFLGIAIAFLLTVSLVAAQTSDSTSSPKPSASKTKQNVAKKKAVVSKKAKESGKSKTKK